MVIVDFSNWQDVKLIDPKKAHILSKQLKLEEIDEHIYLKFPKEIDEISSAFFSGLFHKEIMACANEQEFLDKYSFLISKDKIKKEILNYTHEEFLIKNAH